MTPPDRLPGNVPDRRNPSGITRREHDLLGERDVPETALYGIQTMRAMENFAISGVELREFATLVEALASVKQGAAQLKAPLRSQGASPST
ncbi:MAG TPA: hypothetical protein VM053_03150 [Gemmatimonadaceae bacterium]|nr:hypothetical protein [Gemmatimonadaceae bacterium]